MELRTLEYVDAVARLGSFTRAAEDLLVAQPAVSAQIAKLERELGVRLFVQDRRGATVTAAGEVVVAHAREVLEPTPRHPPLGAIQNRRATSRAVRALVAHIASASVAG